MSDSRYKVIVTGDGTPTLFDPALGEAMHTDSGAYEESIIKHVNASGIFVSGKKRIVILDVGFGLGFNILALLERNHRERVFEHIEVISLELDRGIGDYLKEITFDEPRERIYRDIVAAFIQGSFHSSAYNIRMFFGDARKTVPALVKERMKFDAVFHDAFSPGKNPELWSLDFFEMIHSVMAQDAVLTTYSSAPQVRMALLQAGFRIGRVPSTGRKREGTIAFMISAREELSSEEIEALGEDVKSTVYRDETLDASREGILSRRIEEMRKIREDRQARRE